MQDSALEQDLILSLCIGDGSVTKDGVLRVKHASKHKEYVEHKFSILKPYCTSTRKLMCEKSVEKRNSRGFTKGKEHASWLFTTRSLFKEHRSKFYVNSKRVIPIDFDQWINARVLAYWYMDDGSLDNKRRPVIHLNRYTQAEAEIVQCALFKVLDLETAVSGNAGKLRLRIRNVSVRRFTELVKPAIQQIKCMQYKIPTEFTPEKTCAVCGKIFIPRVNNMHKTCTCSKDCSRKNNYAWHHAHLSYYMTLQRARRQRLQNKTVEVEGAVFTVSPLMLPAE